MPEPLGDVPASCQPDGPAILSAGSPDEVSAAMAGCTRFLQLHGRRSPRELLAATGDDVAIDRYGKGGVVTQLEVETAQTLGKPAAVFLPSGTMAQQATLRVHADRRGRRIFVCHPACHLDWSEGRGYQRLHDLVCRPAGDLRLPLRVADLEAVADAPAALVVELPQRNLGGHLPEWNELLAQTAWARQRGAAAHLDGARLWESGPFYRRSPADIAALFDTVYVSFYKGLGGLSGCCLAGDADVVAEVAEWRTRHGGTLYALWPYAASALGGLHRYMPKMESYYHHARAIAAAVREVPDIDVVPDPPRAPMMHLHLRTTGAALRRAVLALAEEQHIWTFNAWAASDSPNVQRAELSVGDATMEFTADEVREVLSFLVSYRSRARGAAGARP
jgi:threonine aldolase